MKHCSLTGLETIIVASNRFVCDAPNLNSVPNLGIGRFSGIEYPANVHMGKVLQAEALVAPFVERLEALLPAVDNVRSILFAVRSHSFLCAGRIDIYR